MGNDILTAVWPEWRIVRRINRGSYGVVYEAIRTDHGVESRSAIKVISIPQDESELASLCSAGLTMDQSKTYFQEVVNDFVNEIQIMESFKGCQNIVSVEDYKVIEKTDRVGWVIFIRMELLTPLNTYISGKTLSEKEVIKLGCDICSALERCAQLNVIHRDIKPDNIFINEFGDFKLGDFGIARRLENITAGLSQKGTYNYMAPEVEKGELYDATVDIYSLGLVLYWLMNKRKLPFMPIDQQQISPRDVVAANRRRLDGEPLPPPCDASPDLAKVILRACDYYPGRRFANAAAMKTALLNVGRGNDHTADTGRKAANWGNRADETMTLSHHAPYNANATSTVRRASNVRGAQQTPSSEPNEIRTFGDKDEKKGIKPAIIAAIVFLVLVMGAGAFAVFRKKDSDDSENGGTTAATAETAEIAAADETEEPAEAAATEEKEEPAAAASQQAEAASAEKVTDGAEEASAGQGAGAAEAAAAGQAAGEQGAGGAEAAGDQGAAEEKPVVHYQLPTAVPDEYYYYNGHTYALYDASRYSFSTYDEVSDFCHEQGGHLAVINDRSENSYLYDLMKENSKITVFFGYTDKDEEGQWVWDGDESDYENWTRSGDWDLPDNGEGWGGGEWKNGGEDYAEFNYDRLTNWGAPNDTTWNDATFMENTTLFFCEWDYDMREAEAAQS